MATITIQEIRKALNSDKVEFMKQGTGKVIHISSENGFADYNNLLHGATYTHGGTRNSSKNRPAYLQEVNADMVCKKCLEKVSA